MRKAMIVFISLLFSSCFITSHAAQRNITILDGTEPSALFSPAIEVNGLIFTSGQIPIDPATKKIVDGIDAQVHQAMINLQTVLQASGSSLDHLVKVNIYLKNMDDYAKMNEIYVGYFDKAPPARTALQVGKIPLDALIEIEAIAVKL